MRQQATVPFPLPSTPFSFLRRTDLCAFAAKSLTVIVRTVKHVGCWMEVGDRGDHCMIVARQ